MFIVDRDGISYEVGLFKNVLLTPEIHEFGRKHFGHLKMTDHPSTLVPCILRSPVELGQEG
jgi:hypothetical protein